MLFEKKKSISLGQPWNLLPGKMTGQIFIRLLRNGEGGAPFSLHSRWQQRGLWAPESLLFSFYGSNLNQLLCTGEERREGAAFNPSLIASMGFSLFSSRLEMWMEASFVESLEGLVKIHRFYW